MSEEEELLKTLSPEARTLVRNPGSTVAPPRDGRVGRKALEVLKQLAYDPKALEDEGPLGQGGMGVVRLAKQVALDRTVAVKSLRAEKHGPDEVEALLSEAWLAGGLEHPNIAPVYSVSLDAQGLPVIVMKRIEGRTWSTLLRDPGAMAAHAPGKAPLEVHLRILQQVCNAVHFAHARGVVHRDLKPDNVMVGSFGEIYVLDWGIATRPGPSPQLAGTPAYLAPEMLGGPRAIVSERTDVYLLGSILFEVLAGRPPHEGATLQLLAANVIRSNPPMPPGAPEELVELVRHCMNPNAAERPGSALLVRTRLESFLEHQGSLALATQSERRAEELSALLATATPDSTRVYSLFSECRFGFEQALSSWNQNTRARAGLDSVLRAMVGFELKQGAIAAARALLAQLSHPDAALAHELEVVTQREQAKAAELERLQSLERNLDPLVGSSMRLIVSTIIAFIWVVVPLLARFFLAKYPGTEMIASAPLSIFTAVAVVLTTRHAKKSGSQLNRRLLGVVLFGMLVQTIFVIAFYALGRDLGPLSVPVLTAYWFIISGVIAVGLMPSAWPIALAYLFTALGSFFVPSLRHEFLAAGNLTFSVTALFIFRREQAQAVARRG